MGKFTVSRTQVAIAPAVTAEPASAAAYAALTWVEIGGIESVSGIGDQTSAVTFDELGVGRTQTLKGQRSGGTIDIVCALLDDNAGQTALLAAEADDSTADYPIRIIFPNKRNATGTNAVRYVCGRVMSGREDLGTANNIAKINVSIGVTTKVTKVASTAGV